MKAGCFYLLSTAFVRSLVLVVDAAEVGDDDWNWQSDHQHAAKGANGTKNLSSDSFWYHVSVPKDEAEDRFWDKFSKQLLYFIADLVCFTLMNPIETAVLQYWTI